MGLVLMVISLSEDRCLGKGATASCFAIAAAAGRASRFRPQRRAREKFDRRSPLRLPELRGLIGPTIRPSLAERSPWRQPVEHLTPERRWSTPGLRLRRRGLRAGRSNNGLENGDTK
jgi:hypothetical protein